MTRKYTRKTNRQSWSDTAMSKAVIAVKRHKMGTLKASKCFGLPRTTLQRLARHPEGTGRLLMGSRKPVFPPEMNHSSQFQNSCQQVIL